MRGFWYMLESIMAGIILVSFLIVLSSHATTETYTDAMSTRGFEALSQLSQKASFRNRVYLNDIDGIINEIDVPGYYYNVSICDYSGNCNGFDPSPYNVTMWSSSYVFSGIDDYNPKVLYLYIWR